ncbi:MAG: hypothetical protein ABIO19_05460 [Burkholderiaceae bacterium]
MQELISRKTYGQDVAASIEALGAMAVSVANRWMMGWPARVKALLKAGTYLGCLETQVEQEKTILANEPNMRHLARHEILQIYEIRESPPC